MGSQGLCGRASPGWSAGSAPDRAKFDQAQTGHKRDGNLPASVRSDVSSSAVRAWRFPSSRRCLWDRTCIGQALTLQAEVGHCCVDGFIGVRLMVAHHHYWCMQDHVPHVLVGQQVLAMLPAAHSPLQLSANWHVLPSGGLQLSVGEHHCIKAAITVLHKLSQVHHA